MAPASNTTDCFREFFGRRLVGVLLGFLPVNNPDIAERCKSLIFEDGRALTISYNGSYWITNADDVKRALNQQHSRLVAVRHELEETLTLAGVVAGSGDGPALAPVAREDGGGDAD